MAHYLVVAHQTATSPLLIGRAEELTRDDAEAVFTLLVPATHVSHTLVCDETETRAVAEWRAREGAEALRNHGLRVADARIGDSSPVTAIDDALRATPVAYDAVLLSTLPPRMSRWLRLDLPRRVAGKYDVPVLHVMEGADHLWEATASVRRELAAGRSVRPTEPAAVAAADRRIGPPGWGFASLAVVLLAAHVGLMLTLAVQVDARFFIAEGLLLAFFGVLLFASWQMEGPLLPRRANREEMRRDTGEPAMR